MEGSFGGQMNYERNGRNLVITVDSEDQKILRKIRDEAPDEFRSDNTLYECFEELICNSELQWVDPADTGDLTSAPMLGVLDESEEIVERWAFMDYQVRSPLEDLADSGRVVFIS
jgi:hypothetical protein